MPGEKESNDDGAQFRILSALHEIEPLLIAFGQRQGLVVEKHSEEGFCRLKFARKRGGIATIVVAVEMTQAQSFRVSALWWIDDYYTTMRKLKAMHVGELQRSGARIEVLNLLQSALDTIDRWKLRDLDRTDGPFPIWHEKMTFQQFQELTANLPKR